MKYIISVVAINYPYLWFCSVQFYEHHARQYSINSLVYLLFSDEPFIMSLAADNGLSGETKAILVDKELTSPEALSRLSQEETRRFGLSLGQANVLYHAVQGIVVEHQLGRWQVTLYCSAMNFSYALIFHTFSISQIVIFSPRSVHTSLNGIYSTSKF